MGSIAIATIEHSLNRRADLATNPRPCDEGIRFTSSLVLARGKRCSAVAGRCLEHNEASCSAARDRRRSTRAAYQKTVVFVQQRCGRWRAKPFFISLFEGQLPHTQRRIRSQWQKRDPGWL